MKPTEEQLEAYKAMAKESAGADMEAQIRENLQKTCDKFHGNEDKLDRCLEYLNDCAREILGNKNGDVPDEVCFRICRDYFNDEIWKKEDEEKAEREKKQAEKAAKYDSKKKKAAEAKKAEIARKRAETLAKKKAEDEARKKAEEEARKAAEEKRKAEEARKAEVCPGQMDFFAAMGV